MNITLHIETSFIRHKRENCPVCKSNKKIHLYTLYDDRYGMPDDFEVVICEQCQLIYLSEIIAPEQQAELYQRYYAPVEQKPLFNKRKMESVRLWIRDSWLWEMIIGGIDLARYVKKGEKVLDVGCGYGANYKPVKRKGAFWQGVDIDPKVCEYLRSQGLPIFCGSLEDFVIQTNQKFDKLLLSQLLEHSLEPVSLLASAKKCLAPNGEIIISSPNSNSRYRDKYKRNWLHWHVPYHTLHWNKNSLSYLAKMVGLKLKWFKSLTPPSWYFCQKKFQPVERGKKNLSLDLKIKPIKWLLVIPGLRIVDLIYRGTGDAFVASLVENGI